MAFGNQRPQYGDDKPRYKPDGAAPAFYQKPFQDTEKFDVPNGILVRLGNTHVSEKADSFGNYNVSLNIQWANTESLEKNRFGLKPLRLTKTLAKAIIQVVTGITDAKELNARYNALTNDEWKANYEGRTVCIFALEMEVTDQQASAAAGQKVTKRIKTLSARPAPSGYDVSQVAPQSGVIEPSHAESPQVEPAKPLSARAWFQVKLDDEQWHLLAVQYQPKEDTDKAYILAKVKLASAIAKIEEAMNAGKTIDDLKPDVNTYLAPWTIEDAAQLMECTVADLYPLELRALRENMVALFAGE